MNTGERISRRQFLRRGGLLVGGLVLGSLGGCPAPGTTSVGPPSSSVPGVIYSRDALRENRIPPGQHEVADWPVLHAGPVQRIEPGDWSLSLTGLVANGVILSYAQFTAMPQVRVFSDVHCVTRWSRLGNLWSGVGSGALAELAGVKPEARYVIIHAAGSFTSNVPLDEFLEDDVLLATGHDGQPLTAEHGAPVRLVVPRLYFWKSAKWVTGLEFTADDRPGFWERAGYNNHGDPWIEERFE